MGERRLRPRPDATAEVIEAGRSACKRRAWADAWQAFSHADAVAALEAEDLERFALAAFMTNRDEAYLKALERAHQAHLAAGRSRHAARCAFWLGLRFTLRGERGAANGWFSRAQRLLQAERKDCAERGWLLLPLIEQQLGDGALAEAFATAARAARIGERCGDADLVACARQQQGRARLRQAEIEEGLALLDEAMIAVASGALSPLVTGLVYCSVIDACGEVHALVRAREWTEALAGWCAAQPQLVAFTGSCLVHRSQALMLGGAWQAALEEVSRACARFDAGIDPQPPGAAFYQQGEVFRLTGDPAAAEASYRRASLCGHEPQPGLALLRLRQGRGRAAAAAMRRLLAASGDPLHRARLLPAHIEVMRALGEREDAGRACDELEAIAARFSSEVLAAAAAHGRGLLLLDEGDAEAALSALKRAFNLWQGLGAPYEIARVRVAISAACRAFGDAEGAELERLAAQATFERLGARPDLDRLCAARASAASAHGLTAREIEVLRLIASGKTNRAIAAELRRSEKTVDRHVSNILNKLDVTSRAAATAWAYEHKLL